MQCRAGGLEVVGCVELYLIVRGMGRVFLSVDGNDAKVLWQSRPAGWCGRPSRLFHLPHPTQERARVANAVMRSACWHISRGTCMKMSCFTVYKARYGNAITAQENHNGPPSASHWLQESVQPEGHASAVAIAKAL